MLLMRGIPSILVLFYLVILSFAIVKDVLVRPGF